MAGSGLGYKPPRIFTAKEADAVIERTLRFINDHHQGMWNRLSQETRDDLCGFVAAAALEKLHVDEKIELAHHAAILETALRSELKLKTTQAVQDRAD